MYNDNNFLAWCKNRVITRVEYAYKFYLRECQDLKNNPNLNCKFYKQGLNMNTSAYKGFSSRGGKSRKCRWI